MTGTTKAAKATRKEWIGLAVLALPTLLLSVDVSVLYLALPHLSRDLGASATEQLWILDIYSFMLAGFLVTMGTLGDRIGRRKLLLAGGAVFGVASILAAYSTSPEMLIVTRAVLGIAGASLMPSTMALIRNMFQDPKEMGVAIGLWMSCFMGGMALGPVVGGALLEQFWWGSAFLLGVPIMIMLLVLGPVLLPEYHDASAGRIDLVSVVLSLAAILPFIYGLKELARSGWAPQYAFAIAAGLVFGVVFVLRQRRLADPLLDLRLFADRTFSVALAIMMASGVVMAGITLMSTLYLQVVRGFSPLQAGLWMIPENVAMLLVSPLGPVLARRIRPATIIATGLLVGGFGFVLHTQIGATGGLPLLITGLVLASVGIALPMGVTMNLVMAAAPPEKAGSAASMSETGGEFGVAMGVATMGSLGTFVYRDELAGAMPEGLPAGAADSARESIASAVTTAQNLPAELGGALLDAARPAFASGLNAVAVAGIVAFVGLAILSARVLRHVPITEDAAEADQSEHALVAAE